MTTDALRTAIVLYTSGTIDDAAAARYLGLSPERWATYRRTHGLTAPGRDTTREDPMAV
ncbi:hypothetical protein N0B31_04160 [Salinirubellus salinus]|jgi:hypothetical protein|uniref:Uncharacterized protein n=1 Tax=Salinirubellus salinus TaxID=1364945 RepID=A0A9E7R4I9_9EURY|nr:hypothetical protein [Salinirubellus salinus]UWM55482.1 hypothetical protein N0B31_04160 [Salinirubellus salinus]